jgi:caspase domain-containing protein
MFARIRLVTGLIVVAVSIAGPIARSVEHPVPRADQAVRSTAVAGQRRALLIGVTDFRDSKLKARSLKGPGNDVDLFHEVLERAPLSVPAANIAVLKGGVRDPAWRPTRANIQREFARLAEMSTRGDQVVILMAGHGSQQPANKDSADDEPDGLDEIFLPEDAAGWDGSIGSVRNALVDDEIHTWLNNIRNKGAFVWLIVDSCQSGTMARGGEVERQVPMSDLVPAEVIEAVARLESRRGNAGESHIIGLSDAAGDVAALYAANMSETTPEKALPNPNSPIHGLFSYTIADILSQSSTALTYRELALRVLEQYRSIPRYSPTPLFEGGGLDQQVMGQQTWPERPQMLLGPRTPSGTWALRAGSVHGLTIGSILEVFPPAGTTGADRRLGHVKVASVEPTSARVVPVAFDKTAAPDPASLVAASRARVRYYEFGDFRLRVALQQPDLRRGVTRSPFATLAPGAGPVAIERALADLPTSTNGLAERVSTSSADWFVRLIDRRVVLTPSSEWQATAGGHALSAVPSQFIIGDANDPKIGVPLGDALKRIARARNLLRLGSASGSGLRLDLRVVRYPNATATSGRPLLSKPGDVAIHAGEYAEFRVKNPGDRAVDVTVLYVDAGFGIQPLYPTRDREVDNQLKPGEERVVGRFAVTDMPLGWESAVAIAVESSLTRQNFLMLAQDALDTRRGSQTAPPSALQRLLESAMFGSEGTTRGSDVNPATFVVKLVTWRTDPATP